jgi:hypothetical protein
MDYSDYLVFVDESGDHSLASINADWPVFVLCFCIIRVEDYVQHITPAIRRLKCKTFGHDLVVLHEHDIRKRKGAFSRLNQAQREAFMADLTGVMAATDMTIVAVVIDKYALKRKYAQPEHPYYLAMKYGLERIRSFLAMQGQADAKTSIIFEARGAKEDQALELEFRRICDSNGQCWPFDMVIADKKTNSEGLQLADLTARPIGLHVLRPEQANRAWDVLQPKLFTGAHGCVAGNGLKVFPLP